MIKSFRQFLATKDREALEKCLSDDFNPNDEDDLDLLTSLKWFKAPSKNIEAIIIRLTHQELVQKPQYGINCWSSILMVLCFEENFQSIKKLNIFYQSKQLTSKKINKLLKAEPANKAECTFFEHLKHFVKSMKSKSLSMFLWFCNVQNIDVHFTILDELQWHPIARTAGPMLP